MNENIYKLTFKDNIIDAILCLDAVLPGREFFSFFKNIPVVAADGASFKLYEYSLIPDYIIGDLDTFLSNPLSEELRTRAEVIHLPEQETNDFEKSLNFCYKKNWKNILIVGFHGGALEHTLNNWSILKKFCRILNLCVYDEERYAIPIFNSIRFSPKVTEKISIIPQPNVNLTTIGLQWELNNEELELGRREGIKNIAIAEAIEIKLNNGEYLLFIDHRLPKFPVFEKLK
ncbi:MAG: thiamine diphosphokinase [Bacteroidetes bacterium]|nr:MAG: thiamine diphosphokinase [Bacteroidota bacterium]